MNNVYKIKNLRESIGLCKCILWPQQKTQQVIWFVVSISINGHAGRHARIRVQTNLYNERLTEQCLIEENEHFYILPSKEHNML